MGGAAEGRHHPTYTQAGEPALPAQLCAAPHDCTRLAPPGPASELHGLELEEVAFPVCVDTLQSEGPGNRAWCAQTSSFSSPTKVVMFVPSITLGLPFPSAL